jgi:hypothetical protein
MRTLEDALQRQQAVQSKRTIAWILFGILAPVSLLFWSEVVFAFGHLAEVGLLQLLAEFIVALFSTLGAIQMYRSGMRYNKLLADPSRLLDDNVDTEL